MTIASIKYYVHVTMHTHRFAFILNFSFYNLTLWSQYDYPHFIDEEAVLEKLSCSLSLVRRNLNPGLSHFRLMLPCIHTAHLSMEFPSRNNCWDKYLSASGLFWRQSQEQWKGSREISEGKKANRGCVIKPVIPGAQSCWRTLGGSVEHASEWPQPEGWGNSPSITGWGLLPHQVPICHWLSGSINLLVFPACLTHELALVPFVPDEKRSGRKSQVCTISNLWRHMDGAPPISV